MSRNKSATCSADDDAGAGDGDTMQRDLYLTFILLWLLIEANTLSWEQVTETSAYNIILVIREPLEMW